MAFNTDGKTLPTKLTPESEKRNVFESDCSDIITPGSSAVNEECSMDDVPSETVNEGMQVRLDGIELMSSDESSMVIGNSVGESGGMEKPSDGISEKELMEERGKLDMDPCLHIGSGVTCTGFGGTGKRSQGVLQVSRADMAGPESTENNKKDAGAANDASSGVTSAREGTVAEAQIAEGHTGGDNAYRKKSGEELS